MRMIPIIVWCVLAGSGRQEQGRASAERVGRLEHPAIREASGVVASRRHPGIFWVHNDSGNPAALFAVRRDGTLVREYKVGVPNVDWEDITIDDDGHLYLGDIGNNGHRLPLRAIYRLDEPDPARDDDGSPLRATLATYYKFADKESRFDAESLVLLDGEAVVITKHRDGGIAELMAIPLDPPAPLTMPALPRSIGTLPGFTEPATGADLSRDGQRLAVCSPEVARVYRRAGAKWEQIGEARYRADGIEAICWDGDDLLIVGEGREMLRIPEASWRQGRR